MFEEEHTSQKSWTTSREMRFSASCGELATSAQRAVVMGTMRRIVMLAQQ